MNCPSPKHEVPFQSILGHTDRRPIANTTYGGPQYVAIKGNVQRIELHRGCPWADEHVYCFEPLEHEDFPIPELTMNQVEILDMNFLARKDALDIIKGLGSKRVNGKVVYYELICGIHFSYISEELATALKTSRFKRPRIAWDGPFGDQLKIKDAIKILSDAGFKRKDIMLFMIVNWRVPYLECLRKLDLMKVWGVKVCDCCYDGGYKYAVPGFWTLGELKDIRLKCRKHNQLVNFEMDPQATIDQYRDAIIPRGAESQGVEETTNDD